MSTPSEGAAESEGRRPTGGVARMLLRGASWQTMGQVVPLVINLAMTPYIINGLGPARYSIFLLVTTITMLLGQFDGGIGQSALRYFTLYAGRDDRVATTRLLTTVSVIIGVFAVVVTSVVFIVTDPTLEFFNVADDYRAETSMLLRTLTVVVGLVFLRNLYNAVVMARQLFRLTSIALVLGHLTYMVGLVLTIESGWGLRGVAATMVVQQIVSSVVTVPPGLSFLDRRGIGWVRRGLLAEFLVYSWKIQVGALAGLIGMQKDQLVAARVMSAQESGPIGQGTNFANQLRLLLQNAVGPIQAYVGSQVGAHGAEVARPQVERIQRVWVVVVTGWCAVGAPAAYVGLQAWLPPSFALAGAVAAILLVRHFAALVLDMWRIWSLILGYPQLSMRLSLVTLFVNIVASVVLWFPFHILGVVAGTAIGSLVGMIVFTWDAGRTLPVRLRWFVRDIPWWQAVVASVLTAVIEVTAVPYLPSGVLGLISAGLLALPGMGLFVATALGGSGIRTLRQVMRRGRA